MAKAAITVDLNARIANFETELKRATSTLDRFGKKGEQIASGFKSAIGGLGLSIGGGFAIKELGRMADQFNNLQARLKLVSRDMAEFNAANADIIRISNSALAPLATTAQLYTRIAGSVKDLNVSQAEVADTTEAIALSLRISGASAAEATSSMLQFTQAIASGVLRGEEFNAISEAAPRLMQALAQSLNVPIGALRNMASEGQLTRDVLINGLLNELPKLRKEAETLPQTIGASLTILQNKLLLTVGEFDKLTGTTNSFSKALDKIGTVGIEALAVTGANVAFVFKGIGREIGGIAAQLSRLAVGDFKGFSFIGKSIRDDAVKARAELDAFEKRILGGAKASQRATSAIREINLPTGKSDKPKKTGRTSKPVDPLASLLSQTDTAKFAEYTKLQDLLNARFEKGAVNGKQYAEALTVLRKGYYTDELKAYADQLEYNLETERLVAEHLDGTTTALNDQKNAWTEAGRALEDEMRTPLEKANIEFGRLQELLDRGAISWETYSRAVFKASEDTEDGAEKAKNLEDSFSTAFNRMGSAIAKFATTGKLNFKSLISSMLASVAQAMANKAFKQFMDSFGDKSGKSTTGGSSGGGGINWGQIFSSVVGAFFADGGIQKGPGISAYSGQIVSKPTVFPFASGIGLMGEAGAEAILPLKRGKDGKLGVGTSGGGGGGVMVNVSVDATGSKVEGDQTKSGEFGRMIGNAVRGVLIQEMRPGGMLA